MARPRVLLLAEQCHPEWPSLPIVGYKAARALSELADVTLVTHVRNREALLRHGAGRAELAYVDNEAVAAPMYRLSTLLRGGDEVAWTTHIAFAYLPYLDFERRAWRAFRGPLQDGAFDLVHRLTPMSPTLPSPMARRSPVPFVIGPLNGGLRWPAAYAAERRREREWMSHVREVYRVLPYARSTWRHAAAILAAFPHTIAELPEAVRARAVDLPEVGVDPGLFHAGDAPRPPPVTFLYAGRLVPYKCPDVAVEAFVGSEALRECRLLVLGEGPERPRLQRLVDAAGAAGRVTLAGKRTQAEVGAAMRAAHVFVFPSIRELGAGVVVEAMASGLCCLVVDYGGPGGLVDASRGVKVPLAGREELVRSMRREMEALAADPARVASLGAAARRHALEEYAWDAKARKVLEVYRWVLGERPDKPSFA